MQPISKNGYSEAEVMRVLRGTSGFRELDVRYELLDTDHMVLSNLDNVLNGSVSYDSEADIKRSGKFQVSDSGEINYLNNRLKPYVRVEMPKSTRTYDDVVDSLSDRIVRWRFDETSGTTVVSDGPVSGLDLTVINPVTMNQSGIVPEGTSFRFSSSTVDKLKCTTADVGVDNKYSSITGSLWVSLDNLEINQALIEFERTILSANTGLEIDYFESENLGGPTLDHVFLIGLGVSGASKMHAQTISLTGRIEAGVPFHLAFTWQSGSEIQVFVNGENVTFAWSGGVQAGNLRVGNDLWIGNNSIASTPFVGVMDDVVFWSQKLDDQAIFELYQSGLELGSYGQDNFAEWAQGVFILSTPQRNTSGSAITRDVDAYDLCQVLLDDKVPSRYFVGLGVSYIEAIVELLENTQGIPLGDWNVVTSSAITPTLLEWEAGTSKLKILNEMLSAINYRTLWFDQDGWPQIVPSVLPSDRTAEFDYRTDAGSVMLPQAVQTLDLFSTPNQWIATVSDPDKPYLMARYTNTDPLSPTSTVNRGRTIVRVEKEDQAATQTILEAKVMGYAAEDLSIFEEVSFDTGLMPFHSDSDAYLLEYEDFNEPGVFIESSWEMPLESGGSMSHKARRAIELAGDLG